MGQSQQNSLSGFFKISDIFQPFVLYKTNRLHEKTFTETKLAFLLKTYLKKDETVNMQ